jgi:two-component system, NarL family, sensor kinase
VFQESLTNVHRHSGSATACVRVARENGCVTFEVQDHGKGMRRTDLPENDAPATSGIGLRGMTERMREVGGTLEIKSTEQGTVVRAIVPLTERADAAGIS